MVQEEVKRMNAQTKAVVAFVATSIVAAVVTTYIITPLVSSIVEGL
jgi:hypothetical protein